MSTTTTNLTLADLGDIAWQYRWARHKSGKRTLDNFRRVISWRTRDKKIPVADITAAWLLDRAALLNSSGLSDATVNRLMSTITTALDVAVEIGAIPSRPHYKSRKEKGGRTYIMPETTYRSIFHAIESADAKYAVVYAWLVRFLWLTGCRRSEALELKWDDIRSDWATCIFRDTKSGNDREIPLVKEAADLLRNMSLGQKDNLPDRLRSLRGPFTHLSRTTFAKLWALARGLAGEENNPECVPHALRHAYATRMAGNGVPIHHVQRLLGHADIATTMRYTHSTLEDLRRSVELAEAGDE
jgi:integrase